MEKAIDKTFKAANNAANNAAEYVTRPLRKKRKK